MARRTRARTLRVGVDEAGLGPKLGPLGLAAFATDGPEDLRAALGDAIREPGATRGATPDGIEVGDSKKIHQGARKLERLERTVLSTLLWTHGLDAPPESARAFLELTGFTARGPGTRRLPPWYRDLDEALPLAVDPGEVAELGGALTASAEAAGVEARAWSLDLIPALELNRELRVECRERGSKNTWVVARTLGLVRRVLDDTEPNHANVRCDKAGGRDRYGAALARAFSEHALVASEEGRRRSRYSLESLFDRPPTFEIEWLVGGDREDPRISWASCLAKYARELTMRAFNRYWSGQVDALAGTAGYPQDAKRFIADVGSAAKRLRLAPERWIRER